MILYLPRFGFRFECSFTWTYVTFLVCVPFLGKVDIQIGSFNASVPFRHLKVDGEHLLEFKRWTCFLIPWKYADENLYKAKA